MAGLKVLLLLALAVVPAFATNYDISWSTGTDYSSWATGKSIQAGDTVTFQYVAGLHSVDEVNQADYTACSTSNLLSSSKTDGNTVITLSQTGTRYFICGTAGHCGQGMKISIPVSAASTTPSTPSPTTPSGTTPTTTPTTSTPTAKNTPSAAGAFRPTLLAGAFLTGGLALLG